MQIAMFLFVKRNWEKDEKYLQEILHYFTDTNYPLQLFIFPEGTDYDVHSITKSNSYALKNNLPIYKHVLHPRLRGFTYCVEQLRLHHSIDAIYDVTVGYRGNICQSEFDLAMGNLPQNVHFHIKRHPISCIPESTEGIEKWCTGKWAEKEATLDQFYKDGRFVPDQEEKSMITEESSVRYQMIFWIVYWLTFLCVVFMLLYNFWWVRWYAVIVGTILFLQSSYVGGFEMLQVKRHASTAKYGETQNNYQAHSKHTMQNGNGKIKKHAA
jgi:lysocardiolipin and lysophospholipid acyltransferase